MGDINPGHPPPQMAEQDSGDLLPEGALIGVIKLPDYAVPPGIVANLARTCRAWGDECCGGAGGQIGPNGIRYGEPYYQFADAIERMAELAREGIRYATPPTPTPADDGTGRDPSPHTDGSAPETAR